MCVALDAEGIQADNGVRIETAALGFFFLSLSQLSTFNLTFWMHLFFFITEKKKVGVGGWVGKARLAGVVVVVVMAVSYASLCG